MGWAARLKRLLARVGTVVLVLSGCWLLFVPTYDGAAGDRYFFEVYPMDEPDGDGRAYEELPPDLQQAFDEVRDGGTYDLYEHPDRDRIETLESIDYILADGDYYSVTVRSETADSELGEFFDQFLITPAKMLGALCLALVTITIRDPNWQPDTLPRMGKLIALTGSYGVLGINVSIVHGSNGLLLPHLLAESVLYLGVFLLTLLPLLTGGALKQRDWYLVGLSVLPLVGLVALAGVAPSVLFVVLYVLLLGGGLLVCGYLLTDPPTAAAD
ncbi:hypothetical protein ACFQGT_18165 [Natrialbaceae archaeon GCM10025810]|uniref:hypothetical protein n=1 Tax=Halovalidus salilacus TaxID=3075124 RepID=UPI0036213EA7